MRLEPNSNTDLSTPAVQSAFSATQGMQFGAIFSFDFWLLKRSKVTVCTVCFTTLNYGDWCSSSLRCALMCKIEQQLEFPAGMNKASCYCYPTYGNSTYTL